MRALLKVVLPLVILSGCNAVAWQRGRLERGLTAQGIETKTIRLGPDSVRYRDGGEGETLLFLHGFGASALWQWAPQVELLSEGRRIIFPDLLWFGGSSSTDKDYSLNHQIRMVSNLVEHIGGGPVHVIGISYGGLVGYGLASLNPKQVKSLVLIDSPGRSFDSKDYEAMLKRLGVRHIADALLPETPEDVGRLLELAYADPPYTPNFVKRQVLSELYGEFMEEKRGLLEDLVNNRVQLHKEAQALAVPAMVIWGELDTLFPVAVGEQTAEDTGATLHIIKGAGHSPNLEKPEEVAQLIRQFIEGLPELKK